MAISVWILSLIHLLGNVCGNRKMLRTTRARSGLKSISLQSTHLSHQRLHSKQRFIIPTLMKRDRYVVEFFLCFSLRHLHFLNTLSTIKQLFSHNFVGLFANYQCWKLETCNKNRPSDSSSCRLGERSRTRTSVEVTVMCCVMFGENVLLFPVFPFRADLAEEYSKDRKKFMKNAEEFTKKNSEKRPSD